MSGRCRIHMLGQFRLESPTGVVMRFRTHKTGALLAYLAFFSDRDHSREQIVELLWPESKPDAGRQSLRTALSWLRRQLEPPGVASASVILAGRSTIALNPHNIWTDIDTFQTHARRAATSHNEDERTLALQYAVDAYSGNLLPGLYESWIPAQQRRLSDQFAGAVLALILAHRRNAQLDDAISVARRAIAIDATHEEVHVALMQSLIADDQHSAAARQYHDLERMLADDLDRDPGPDARGLVEQIDSSSSAVPNHSPAHTSVSIVKPAEQSANSTHNNSAAILARTHVPRLLTRFFGREQELDTLSTLLVKQEAKLVTLVGPPGCGKTRLSIEAAAAVADAFNREVWFVPLSDISSESSLPGAIADRIAPGTSASGTASERIADALADRPTLVILDNMEHLLPGAASMVGELLSAVPSLQCLVTSRHTLVLEAEHEVHVDPLPTPDPASDVASIASCASVQLFLDRASAMRPGIELTPDNAATIAELCDRLEGIPLAIELAAARAQVLTPAQMLQRLDQRFKLLVSKRRGEKRRHRSLLAAIESSFDLLSEDLRAFFTRLSVFRDGWTGEAAQAICDQPLALDLLEQLYDCSMITTREQGDKIRFGMLETLREFAADRLDEEQGSELACKHTMYFASLAIEGAAALRGPDQAAWAAMFATEDANMLAALDWAMGEDGRNVIGMELTASLGLAWGMSGKYDEGRKRIRSALVRWPGQTLKHAKAMNELGLMAMYQADHQDAKRMFSEALALNESLGDDRAVAGVLSNIGMLHQTLTRYDLACDFYEKALTMNRRIGNRVWEATNLNNLGSAAFETDDLEAAREYWNQALPIRQELGDVRGEAVTRENLALVAMAENDFVLAQKHCATALKIFGQLGDPQGQLDALDDLARIEHAKGNHASAVSLIAFIDAQRAQRRISRRLQNEHVKGLAESRDTLGDAEFERLSANGAETDWKQVLERALDTK